MTQTILTIFMPTLMVLVGILLNRADSARLDACISSLQNQLDGRMSGLESRLHGRISALEARPHADMIQVSGKLTELGVRVARLEAEQ